MVIGRIIKSGKGRRPCLCPRFGKLGLLERVSSRITKNDVFSVSVEYRYVGYGSTESYHTSASSMPIL
jgi:hypothetical protein